MSSASPRRSRDARRAGVGNATMYRHFPTRRELVIAVYAGEVTALCELGRSLLAGSSPADALFCWLRAFITHVATKRELPLSIPDDTAGRRSGLYRQWHDTMRATAAGLLGRAQDAGAVRSDLTSATSSPRPAESATPQQAMTRSTDCWQSSAMASQRRCGVPLEGRRHALAMPDVPLTADRTARAFARLGSRKPENFPLMPAAVRKTVPAIVGKPAQRPRHGPSLVPTIVIRLNRLLQLRRR